MSVLRLLMDMHLRFRCPGRGAIFILCAMMKNLTFPLPQYALDLQDRYISSLRIETYSRNEPGSFQESTLKRMRSCQLEPASDKVFGSQRVAARFLWPSSFLKSDARSFLH